jgi:CRISPR-associated protein Cas2
MCSDVFWEAVMREAYFNIPLDEGSSIPDTRWYVLVIYDIADDRRRTRLAKLLNGFGIRVQKSAFEAILNRPKYQKLMQGLKRLLKDEDECRVYRIRGRGEVAIFGPGEPLAVEDVVVL